MRIDLTPIDSPEWIPPPRRTWTDEQWEHLRHGMEARRMEDKWRSYVVGQRLFLHRSWTGKGIFEAEFVRADNGWHVVDAVAETGWTGKTKPELSDMLARLIDLAAGWDIAEE